VRTCPFTEVVAKTKKNKKKNKKTYRLALFLLEIFLKRTNAFSISINSKKANHSKGWDAKPLA